MTDAPSIYLTQARAAFDDASSDPQRALLLGRDLSMALTRDDGVAWMYARLAVAISSLTIEEYGVAAEAADDVITVAGALGEHAAKRAALRTQASCQRAEGQWRSADRTLRTTVDLAFAAQDTNCQIAGIVQRAQMYEALGSFVVAMALFDEATRLADESRNKLTGRLAASAQLNAAHCAWLLCDNARTVMHLNRAKAELSTLPRGTFHVYHDALALQLLRRSGGSVKVNAVLHLLNEARASGLAAIVVELDAELALAQGVGKGLETLLECVQRWRSRREFARARCLLTTLDGLVSKTDTLPRGALDRERTATVLHAVRARGAALERLENRPVFGRKTPTSITPSRETIEAKAVLMQLKTELHAASDMIATQLGWPASSRYSCFPASEDGEQRLAAVNGRCLAASVRRDVERLAKLHAAREHSDLLPEQSDIGRRLATLERLVGSDPARAIEECDAIEHSLTTDNDSERAEIATLRVEALFTLESWPALQEALRSALDGPQSGASLQRLHTIEVAFNIVQTVSQGNVRAATQKLADARANGRTRDALTVLGSLAQACDEVALLEPSIVLRTRGVEIAELCDDPSVHRSGAMLALELSQRTDPQAGQRWLGRAEELLRLSPSPYYQALHRVAEHTLALLQSPDDAALKQLRMQHDEASGLGWEGVKRRAATALGYVGQLDHDAVMRLCDDLSRCGHGRDAAELALKQSEFAASKGLARESRALSQLSYRLSRTVEDHQLQVAALHAEELDGFPDLLPLPITGAVGDDQPLATGLASVDDALSSIASDVGCDTDDVFARSTDTSGGFTSAFGPAKTDSTRADETALKVRAILAVVEKSASKPRLENTAPHLSVPDDAARQPS